MRDYRQRIGTAIARARRRHGWSQNELARRTGIPEITDTQISRWERGTVMPNPDNLEALERALGIELIPIPEDDDDDEPVALVCV